LKRPLTTITEWEPVFATTLVEKLLGSNPREASSESKKDISPMEKTYLSTDEKKAIFSPMDDALLITLRPSDSLALNRFEYSIDSYFLFGTDEKRSNSPGLVGEHDAIDRMIKRKTIFMNGTIFNLAGYRRRADTISINNLAPRSILDNGRPASPSISISMGDSPFRSRAAGF
jgi:hypothetical protein